MRGTKNDIPLTQQNFGVQTREIQWGEMSSSIDTFPRGFDFSTALKGLPDDACQCPHWGHLIKGNMRVRYTDGTEEEIHQGDAFYMKPGHVPYIQEECEWILFSPADKMRQTREQIARNAENQKRRAA